MAGPETLKGPLMRFSASATASGQYAQPMRSAYLSLNVDTDKEAERIFAALSNGGRVLMPMEETFFATRFGQVQDRFGVNWMVLNERPAPAQ